MTLSCHIAENSCVRTRGSGQKGMNACKLMANETPIHSHYFQSSKLKPRATQSSMSAASNKSVVGGFKSGKLLLELLASGELAKSKDKISEKIVKHVAELVQEVKSTCAPTVARSGGKSDSLDMPSAITHSRISSRCCRASFAGHKQGIVLHQ